MKSMCLRNMVFAFCLLLIIVGCGGKTTSLEGKVVDGKGQPLANVKVAAKMSQPIKGYEQFEDTTGSDGSFKFKKLFRISEYQLIFYSDRWSKEFKIKTESGPEGQTKMLPEPVMVRFMDDQKKGVVLDTKTGLMWAAKDNGGNINWFGAKNYCESYKGGGYAGWRMPTQDELASLHEGKGHEKGIQLTADFLWASETRPSSGGWGGSETAYFGFNGGYRDWIHTSYALNARALPVRSGK